MSGSQASAGFSPEDSEAAFGEVNEPAGAKTAEFV